MNTCNFNIDGIKYRDQACFATLLIRNKYDNASIIIPKRYRKIFDIDEIFEYLDDLKEMGFDYDYYKLNSKESIHIELGRNIANNTNKLMAFCMAVRYIWEGSVKPSYAIYEYEGGHDRFYKVVQKYFLVKKTYPIISKLEMLCLASNIQLIEGLTPFNSNHFWCCSEGCKIIKKLDFPEPRYMVNSYFTRDNDICGILPSKNTWNFETIDKLYNKLIQ